MLDAIDTLTTEKAIALFEKFGIPEKNDSINGREHEYLRELHHSNNPDYMADFKAGYSKYFGLLDAVRNG